MALPDRSRFSRLRAASAILVVVYLWSLPVLAEIGFAHKCPNYPGCDQLGMSVSNFISTPQATGAMGAIFFYPTLQCWLNFQYVRRHRMLHSTLVVFQIFFGIFLMCPVTEVPKYHGVAVGLFCISALVHYGVLMRYCTTARLWHCQVLILIASFCFAMVLALVMISRFNKTVLRSNVPELFYVMESSGLSAMAVFPVVWYREQPPDLHVDGPSESFSLPHQSDIMKLRITGTMLPVLYVWTLPLLAEVGFANKCVGYPQCEPAGMSVSSYIGNARATGAMAACFFYPSMHLWQNAQYIRHQKLVYPTLTLFQASFGFFLIVPSHGGPRFLHGLATLAMCLVAIALYYILNRHCANQHLHYCTLLVRIAVSALAAVLVIAILAKFNRRFFPEHAAALFYIVESIGLSAMALFPLLWYREGQLGGESTVDGE